MFGAAEQDKIVGALNDAKGEDVGVAVVPFLQILWKYVRGKGLSPEDLPTIISFAQELFDQYVVPYDFPFIDGLVEVAAENAVRESLPLMIRNLLGFPEKPSIPEIDADEVDDAPEEEDGAADGA
jgi:hypothetical protein